MIRVVTDGTALAELVREAKGAGRLAVDLEASGMFAYQAAICTMQLAWGEHIALVDTLAVPVSGLRALLDTGGPTKVVHDVAFDARLLAEAGVELGNVHDTAIAARMLGRTATGLASLLASELGLTIDKAMQHYDWRVRPLDAAMLDYLAADVAHLETLERALWAQVTAAGIEPEVLEETRYRIASAVAAVREPEIVPPYVRIKGVAALPERDRAALRVLAALREQEARRRDVPPYRVASNETLVAIVRARPKTVAELGRMRGVATSTPAARAFVEELARGLASAETTLPEEDRRFFEKPRVPATEARARREREVRLLSWRRAEAKRRGVDEQVVLPGHCAKDVVERELATVDELARIPGIGAFRVSRDGEAMLKALHTESAPEEPASTTPPGEAP